MSLTELVRPLLPRHLRSPLGCVVGDDWCTLAQRAPSGPPAWRGATVHWAGTGSVDADATDLRDALDAAGMTAGSVHGAIISRAVDVFPLTLPTTDPAGMNAAVVTEAQVRLSYSLEQAVIDYAPLPPTIRRPGEEGIGVLVFAIPRMRVAGWLDRLEAVGLWPRRLQTAGCVMAQHIASPHDTSRHLVISTGDGATSIAVVEAGAVLMERFLDWGLRHATEAAATALDLTPTAARELVLGNPYARPAVDTPMDDVVRDILGPAYHRVLQESTACLGYCTSFLQHHPTDSAVCVGPLATAGLRTALEKGLGVNVTLYPDPTAAELSHRWGLAEACVLGAKEDA